MAVNKKNLILVCTASAILIFCALLFCGCAAAVSLRLTRESITLTEGERRDISPYIKYVPSTANLHYGYALESDSDVIGVAGSSVIALKTGEGSVRVIYNGGELSLKITVVERAPSELNVTVTNQIQTAQSDIQKVSFSADIGDSSANIEWRAGELTGTGKTFEFTPSGYGEHTVIATAGDYTSEHTVKVYRPTECEVHVSGTVEGATIFAPILFWVNEITDSRNPHSVYEWTVNGVTAGECGAFTFTPTAAGEYVISLYLNGRKVTSDEGGEITVTAGDTVRRSEVRFDDEGGVFVYIYKPQYKYVSIICGGVRQNFDVTDARYAHLFNNGRFDASEFINPFGADSYTVIVDGERFEFDPIAEAKEYASNKVLTKNSFITSEDDARDYVDELIATGSKRGECYSVADFADIMRARAGKHGVTATVSADGNIGSIVFSDYAAAPTKYSTSDTVTVYPVLPHIEYNADNLRGKGYSFDIDYLPRTVDVSSSDMLVVAAEKGYKPNPTDEKTVALYRAVKNVLLRIIGADYTDRQKVHAIYDWLQWVTVKYDGEQNDAAHFLEGVFSAQKSPRSGYSVSDRGAAKCFSLMCAIEGIECLIDRDTTWSNIVKVDGMYYACDVYGGKIDGEVYGESNTELCSHVGLLGGAFALLDGAAVDNFQNPFLQKFECGGYYDYSVAESEQTDKNMFAAIVKNALDNNKIGDYRIPYVTSEIISASGVYGFELYLQAGVNKDEVIKSVRAALGEYEKTKDWTFSHIHIRSGGSVISVAATVTRS